MPPRATWKGFLNLSLVSVAVKAFTATSESNTIRLNQLHAGCNSRIKYDKRCPVHGSVTNDEIVKGYEYAKDQYVIIDLDELDQLRTREETRTIRIDHFVDLSKIDPIYLGSNNYYLVPDGAPGQKPYALIHRAMQERNVGCVAQVVLSQREQLVLVRPLERLLCMTSMRYAAQVKEVDNYHEELVDIELSAGELNLARTLIEETTGEDLEIDKYRDDYNDKLNRLIEAKVSGEQLVAAPSAEPAHVINLMDALKASVERVKEEKSEPAPTMKKTARRKKADPDDATDSLKQELARKAPRKNKKKSSDKKQTG